VLNHPHTCPTNTRTGPRFDIDLALDMVSLLLLLRFGCDCWGLMQEACQMDVEMTKTI
jgi:cell wall-associated NlpC family hydrolase